MTVASTMYRSVCRGYGRRWTRIGAGVGRGWGLRRLSERAGSTFGVAFDIDGVLVRGGKPINGVTTALRRLYDDPSSPTRPRIPFIFLTNGGGMTESSKAAELSKLLQIPVFADQVLLGHTPFRKLVNRFGDKQVLAVGKQDPLTVMTSYGFKKVNFIDDYVAKFEQIDGLASYKPWELSRNKSLKENPGIDKIEAVFVVSDPLDWGRDLQVLCDVLRSGGEPGKETGPQPPLFFAADDFEYQGAFPVARFGMGAFRIALESLYNRLSETPLSFTSYGKPEVSVYKFAAQVLHKLATRSQTAPSTLHTIYMVGDNPATDIRGANEAGQPWTSVLTRTGVFRQHDNDPRYPAHKVVDDVVQAIDFIVEREKLCGQQV